jgi:alpha-mannosidase
MSRPIVHLIPHTHWDREWYLPLGAFRARLVVALDALFARLETDNRIRCFLLDGQAILIEDYLLVRPERREAVAELVRAGRLQVGPWYVLADEQVPAGESLIRNLLLGGSVAQRFGGLGNVLYSPDAFGHPGCLPALGNEFGIRRAVVWRGLAPEQTGNRDLFWWESPGGARVLAYHLPQDGYEIGVALPGLVEGLAERWRRVAQAVLPRAATKHVAVFVGADHHAARPDLGDLADRLAAVAPECEFRFSCLEDFFEAAESESRDLAVVRGELRQTSAYTWALQGVHSTRAQLKRRNSAIELRLVRVAEPLAAMLGGASVATILRQAWREVVESHFHDAIGGCVHDAVARAMAVRFDDAEAATTQVVDTALDRLAGHDPDLARQRESHGGRLVVWNPVARARGGIVMAELTFFRRDVLVGPPGGRKAVLGPGARPFVLHATQGKGRAGAFAPQILEVERSLERVDALYHYPDQDEVDRVTVAFSVSEALSGMSGRLYALSDGTRDALESFACADGRHLWNGQVGFRLDQDGTTVLRTKGSGRPYAGLLALESERDMGDTYTFCPAPRDTIRRPNRPGRARVTAPGPLVAGLEWGIAMRCGGGVGGGLGRVAAKIRVQAIGDSPVLRCRIALDNQAIDHRLRLRFPTGIARAPVLAGTQFGVVERMPAPRSTKHPIETPVTTAPAHRFVAAARGGRGLALFAPGFFEYEWTSRGDLVITLLRAVGELSRADLRTRPGHAGWPTPTPGAQGLGTEVIELGLAPISVTDLAAPERLMHLWEDCFLPPVTRWIRNHYPAKNPRTEEAGCTLEGDGLVLSAVKPAEDGRGLVVRCANLRGALVQGRLRFARRLSRAAETRADESPIGEIALEESGSTVAFALGGHGMISVRVEWAD